LRSGQAVEDRQWRNKRRVWFDEHRAVNRRDAQQQRGHERERSDARELIREARGVAIRVIENDLQTQFAHSTK
jgi:hypothetical protein